MIDYIQIERNYMSFPEPPYPFPPDKPPFFSRFPVANSTLSNIVAIVSTPPTIAHVLPDIHQ